MVTGAGSTTPRDRSTDLPFPVVERSEAYRRVADRPAAAFRLFEKIAGAWNLSWEQRMALIGIEGRTRYARWHKDPATARLNVQQAERLSQITAIANHLYSVHAGAREAAESWVRRPNAGGLYGGRAPIELMTSGPTEALIATRADLAGWDRR